MATTPVAVIGLGRATTVAAGATHTIAAGVRAVGHVGTDPLTGRRGSGPFAPGGR